MKYLMLGLILGFLVSSLIYKLKAHHGTIYTYADDNNIKYVLNIDNLETLSKSKYIVFNIKKKDPRV